MEHSSKGKSSISTHAPLAGRDRKSHSISYVPPVFQPTRPLRGATPKKERFKTFEIFQPTRPLRGATIAEVRTYGNVLHFNPRAPCGARHSRHRCFVITTSFQPTRPLRGATLTDQGKQRCENNFNPRAPCGARPNLFIKVHSLRNFNPRAPCGARPLPMISFLPFLTFQPTRPLRGATSRGFIHLVLIHISTHAPLAGRDCKSVQITMHIFAITDKFQMFLRKMPTVRAFCSFLMQENHADFGCEPPK